MRENNSVVAGIGTFCSSCHPSAFTFSSLHVCGIAFVDHPWQNVLVRQELECQQHSEQSARNGEDICPDWCWRGRRPSAGFNSYQGTGVLGNKEGVSLKRSTKDAPKFVTEDSTLATGAEQGLAVPGAATQHRGPCPARRVQHPCGTMDTAGTQRGWPGGCSAEGPCACGPTGLPGWHGGSGGVGSSGGVTHSQSRHISQRRREQGGEPPTQGRGVGTCSSLCRIWTFEG